MSHEELAKLQYEGWTTGDLYEEWVVLTRYVRDFADREQNQKRVFSSYRAKIAYIEKQFQEHFESYPVE